jgi:hypothetical protein
MLLTELPSAATRPIATTKSGKVISTSVTRPTARSGSPPKKAADPPITVPPTKESSTEEKAIARSSRVATSTRLRMSRPT